MTTFTTTLAPSLSFTEGSSATPVDSSAVVTGGTGYGGGHIRYSLANANSGDQFILTSSQTPNAVGAISFSNGTVYVGTGTATIAVGSIDSTLNGLNGNDLQINFTSNFANPSFENGAIGVGQPVTGWTVGDQQVKLGSTVIGGYTTPTDTTFPATTSAGVNQNTPVSVAFTHEIAAGGSDSPNGGGTGGVQSLRLSSSMTTALGYDIVDGPYALSNTFASTAGDVLYFDWKAAGGSDAYDVFGYLLNIDTGASTIVLNQTGADASVATPWATLNVTVPTTGNYAFVFVAGTWDATGGKAAGGSLYLDNFKVYSNSVTDSVVQAIARQVDYQNTATDAPVSRVLTVSVAEGSGTTAQATTNINITNINNQPVFSSGATLAAVNEDTTSPSGASVSTLLASHYTDPDNAYSPSDSLAGIAISGDASTPSQGLWQYSTDGGSTWNNVGSVSTSNALLLTSSSLIRFVPAANWNGTPGSLSVHAVDSSAALTFTDGASTSFFDTTTDPTTSSVANSPVSLGTSITPVNDPYTGAVSIDGSVRVGQVLTSNSTLADVDGMGTLHYQWQADGVNINGATASTFTLTGTELGKVITVIVSYVDGAGNAESATSVATGAVNPANYAPTGGVTIDNMTPSQGDVLTAANTLDDLDGIPVGGITYTWMSGSTVLGTGPTYTLQPGDAGNAIHVVASYTDLLGNAESMSSSPTSSVINVDDAPTGGVAINNMTPSQGDVLTASNTLGDLDGIPVGGITYTWMSGSTVLGSGPTYTLSQADVGKSVYVVASYTDNFSHPESVSSSPTSPVINVNDVPTGGVAINNMTPSQGDVLTASNTLADLDVIPVGGITYTWMNGSTVLGTGETYTLSQADVGTQIHVVASYTDGFGHPESVSSGPTGAVINVPDAPVLGTPVTITYVDTPFVDTFATVTGTLVATDADAGAVFRYGIVGGTVDVIAGTVTAADAYGTLTVNINTGAYSFVPNSAAIEPLGAGVTDTTLTVTVTDETNLSSSKAFSITINESGVTETVGNDSIVGTAGNDNINALAGDDTINGGAGADTMAGGSGSDTYFVDNAGDVVIEAAIAPTVGGNQEWDLVNSSITYTLGANVEALVLTGTAVINGTGNATDNRIIGNSADNILTGGAGADWMTGGAGNDTYNVDNTNDRIDELTNQGWDTVWTSASFVLADNVEALWMNAGAGNLSGYGNNTQANYMVGNEGNNLLNGQAGADTMIGGLGNDSYYVDNVGDVVTETAGQGTDAVYASISYDLSKVVSIENLTLTGTAAINAMGNGTGNVLTGNSADNTLNDGGSTGVATMVGGAGNDTYIVNNAGDVITETLVNSASGGWDMVYSSVSYSLATATNVDALILNGTAAINATGNASDNRMIGNSADNIMNGGTGADWMTGGAGNDTYNIDNAGDRVDEMGNEGWDTVWTSIVYTLPTNAEALWMNPGTGNLSGYGNYQDNYLVGNEGNNLLDAQAGNDTLVGGLGADTLVGSLGADRYELGEATASTDTVRIALGDSKIGFGNYDYAVGFKLGTGTVNTSGVDQLDLVSTTIAANGVVDGVNSGPIMSHQVSNGMITFDSSDTHTSPLAISDGYLGLIFDYLQNNITGGQTVGFVSGGNTYVFQDSGSPATVDTLVELLGVSATSLSTTGLAANAVWIV